MLGLNNYQYDCFSDSQGPYIIRLLAYKSCVNPEFGVWGARMSTSEISESLAPPPLPNPKTPKP